MILCRPTIKLHVTRPQTLQELSATYKHTCTHAHSHNLCNEPRPFTVIYGYFTQAFVRQAPKWSHLCCSFHPPPQPSQPPAPPQPPCNTWHAGPLLLWKLRFMTKTTHVQYFLSHVISYESYTIFSDNKNVELAVWSECSLKQRKKKKVNKTSWWCRKIITVLMGRTLTLLFLTDQLVGITWFFLLYSRRVVSTDCHSTLVPANVFHLRRLSEMNENGMI